QAARRPAGRSRRRDLSRRTAAERYRANGEECRRRTRGARHARDLCALSERPGPVEAAHPRSCGRDRAQYEHRGEAGRAGEGDRMSRQTRVPLEFEGEQLEGVLVGRRDSQARPAVILVPTVMGVSDLEIAFGSQLVELGYNGFVADI